MSEKLVRVHLRGGLGNQLFQYGAGCALALRGNAQLLLDSSLLPLQPVNAGGVSQWPSQISEFRHLGQEVKAEPTGQTGTRLRSSLLQLDRKLGDLLPVPMRKLGRFSNEERADFQNFDSLTSRRIVLNSYCNSPLYFLDFSETIRNSICSLRQPSSEYLELTSEAAETRPLAVHIRLGDYKNLSKIYGRVDPDYLVRAIDLQMQLSGEREIWLFSDEPSQAIELFGETKYKIVVPPLSEKLTGLETILIMASCLGLVASNSTFSWWSAFLNTDNQAWAVFPRPFFARSGPQEPKDWLQVNWIQLGRKSD